MTDYRAGLRDNGRLRAVVKRSPLRDFEIPCLLNESGDFLQTGVDEFPG